ncbi:MAG: PEP-CTERM sorting domain-containing protein [Candidatus Omnitrophica bacterium]|nr:PEP-CTERM sorting domain-containing protein [Candidatus Omnitrophota bacterium]MCA9449368.1 PEP-CTERM sorting domain-containing protein [Candidatus Omnitrophota bacterium]MCB9767204.1 PEP-CTERM sorting domain-containing protein [Candidatus Omnitrophota bacterium]MCB9781426.1 PEP-CTERM sorting domain-containing protein [Candidatus Omnitrophota bacterium]
MEKKRDRLVRIGKRSLLALVLLAVAIAVCAQIPEWIEMIPKIEPVFTAPAAAEPVPQETIPEPATMALLGMGGAALFYRRAKSKNQV